jgi:hypothetical protein
MAPFTRKLMMSLIAGSAVAMAGAVPAGAAPPSDAGGYVDSTARCASATDLVAFGSTSASRVAICKTAHGLQYRGVRVQDGARLILSASREGNGAFVADNNGITYTVTSSDLAISAGSRTLREEPMLDFHSNEPAPQPAPTTTSAPDPDLPPLPAEVGGSGS